MTGIVYKVSLDEIANLFSITVINSNSGSGRSIGCSKDISSFAIPDKIAIIE